MRDAKGDPICTARNQRVRIGRLRRTVLQIAGQPVAFDSPSNHAVDEQASNPISSRGRPRFERTASPAAPASFMIWPVSSTTQIAVSSNAPSRPEKTFMAAPFRCSWRSDTDHVRTNRQEQPPASRLGSAKTPITPSDSNVSTTTQWVRQQRLHSRESGTPAQAIVCIRVILPEAFAGMTELAPLV